MQRRAGLVLIPIVGPIAMLASKGGEAVIKPGMAFSVVGRGRYAAVRGSRGAGFRSRKVAREPSSVLSLTFLGWICEYGAYFGDRILVVLCYEVFVDQHSDECRGGNGDQCADDSGQRGAEDQRD